MKSNFLKIIIASLFLLPGCGRVDDGQETSSTQVQVSDGFVKTETTIKVLTMIKEGNAELFESFVSAFKEVEPNVNVVPIYISGGTDYDSLQRQAIVGFFKDDFPDVIQCYPDHVVNYLRLGKVLNVKPYLDHPVYGISAEDKEDYIQPFMEEGSQFNEEGTYSLPFCKSTELMYYNKNLVLNADLTEYRNTLSPELKDLYQTTTITEEYLADITWEEFFDYLAPGLKYIYGDTLTDYGKQEATILTYKSTDNLFVTLASEYGGYTDVDDEGRGQILFDNPTIKEKIKKLNSYISHYKTANDGSIITPDTYECSLFDSEKLENHYNFAKSAFKNSRALFTITSNASVMSNVPSSNSFDVGITSIPRSKNGKHMAISQGTPFTFLDHQDENRALASYLFWKYVTNRENSLKWSLYSGYIGIRNSNYGIVEPKIPNLEKGSPAYNVYMKQYYKLREMPEEMFQTKTFRGSSTCRDVAGQMFLSLLNQSTLDDDIIDEKFSSAVSSINKYL